MKIIDNDNLIPDKSILERIIKEHPFHKNLDSIINNLVIKLSTSTSESIELNFTNNDVTLSIFRETPSKSNYESILYHEFSHITDKLNKEFKYSDEKRDSLTGDERKKVLELWNVYIDARLNDRGLFQLENNEEEISLKVNGEQKILPYNINTEIMLHIENLELRDVKNAKNIIEEIWNNPNRFRSYKDMIDIIK